MLVIIPEVLAHVVDDGRVPIDEVHVLVRGGEARQHRVVVVGHVLLVVDVDEEDLLVRAHELVHLVEFVVFEHEVREAREDHDIADDALREVVLVDIARLPEPAPDIAVYQGVRVVRVELVGGVSGHGITNEQWVAYTCETLGLGEFGGFLVELALEVVARGHRVADDAVCGLVARRCVAVELHGRARGVPRALDGVFGDLVLVGNDRAASDGDCGGEDARECRRDDAGARDAATGLAATFAPARDDTPDGTVADGILDEGVGQRRHHEGDDEDREDEPPGIA